MKLLFYGRKRPEGLTKMENTKIYKCTRKVNGGFEGFIKVFDGNKYLWILSSKIVRLNRTDARDDAINLYLDHCIKNNNSLTI